MRCSACGSPALADDAHFCVACGGPLEEASSTERSGRDRPAQAPSIPPRTVQRRRPAERAPAADVWTTEPAPTVPVPVVIGGVVVLLVVLLVLMLST